MRHERANQLQDLLATGAFQAFLGAELLAADGEAGSVELRFPWRPQFERTPGSRQWHGGPIAAMIDVAGDFALIAMIGHGVPTIDLRVDYLRPAIDTNLQAKARVLRKGRSIGTVDIEVRNDVGCLIAAGRGTYSMLPSSSQAKRKDQER